jgi:hypothetical protein
MGYFQRRGNFSNFINPLLYQTYIMHLYYSETPYIMDPANPFNDMYHGLVGGKAFDWKKVVRKARIWLSKPLFSGVNTSNLW